MTLDVKKKVKLINFNKTEKIEEFLENIDITFGENKKISNPPWKYKELSHFHFLEYSDEKSIDGVLVYSLHDLNYHLNFLYVLPGKRSKGFGKTLMNEFVKLKGRKYHTIHVDKKLKKTINFYGRYYKFKNEDKIGKCKDLIPFKKKCVEFNKDTYNGRILLFKVN